MLFRNWKVEEVKIKLYMKKFPLELAFFIDERKKWLIKSFKETGILFIDEEKEKSQIEENFGGLRV